MPRLGGHDSGMRRPRPLPIAERAFSVRSAIEQGVSPDRLRRSDLMAPLWGVRTVRQPHASLAELCAAFASRAGPSTTFSHRTAALLHDIPVPSDAVLPLDAAGPGRAIRAKGVRGHQLALAEDERVRIGDVHVTSPERTWCDLAAWLSDEDLLAAGDRLIWRRDPLCTRADLARISSRMSGGRGAQRRRRVLPLVSDRADSRRESKLRWRLISAGLPALAVNPEIHHRGAFIGMPDLAFLDFRMAIDYEGRHHLTDPKQWHKDLARVPRFENAGWHMTRAASPDLQDSTVLLRNLRARLIERGWQP